MNALQILTQEDESRLTKKQRIKTLKIEGPKSCKPDSYLPMAKCRLNSAQLLGGELD